MRALEKLAAATALLALTSCVSMADRLEIDRLPADYVHNGGEPREAASVDMVVIHTIGGPLCEDGAIRFAEITGDAVWWRDWFLRQNDKSIHYIVGRDGGIAQQRPDLRTAGHVSYHGVRENVNARSIGIEIVNNGDGTDPFPPVQLTAVTALVKDIAARFNIGPDNIYSHAELDTRALEGCPGHNRRVDPGPLFPMDDLKASVALQ